MTKDEKETILRYDAVDNCWYGYSTVTKHMNAMEKKGWTTVRKDEDGIYMKAPSHSVKISNAQKPRKQSMTEEQKEAMQKRLIEGKELKKARKIA